MGDGFSELECSAWLPELFSFFPLWLSQVELTPYALCSLCRTMLCKMLNHKNETPVLCINQQLVAVVTAAVCLIAGYYAFVCQKETQCLRRSTSSRIYPTCFLSPSRHHAQQTQHFPICCVFEKCPLFPISLRVKQVRYTSQIWLAGSYYPGITIG